MQKKQTENLPALPTKTFIVPVDETVPVLDTTAVDLIDEADVEGYEPVADVLPYVSIRQKPLMDSNGTQLSPAGTFKLTSKLLRDGTIDVPGNQGLVVSILGNQLSRVYFKELTDKQPTCKSNDAIQGIGTPGGNCKSCLLSQWVEGKRPTCQTNYKILCWDHNSEGLFYVLTLGPSGLRHYDDHRRRLKYNTILVGKKKYSIPEHFISIHITTAFVAEPAAHYIPVFTILGQLNEPKIIEAKQSRTGYADLFQKTIDVTIETNADAETNTGVADPGGELSPGATRVETVGSESSGDGAPPF